MHTFWRSVQKHQNNFKFWDAGIAAPYHAGLLDDDMGSLRKKGTARTSLFTPYQISSHVRPRDFLLQQTLYGPGTAAACEESDGNELNIQ